jgi:hypothetical protein
VRVVLGAPQGVRDGDTIAFGKLNFKVKIVSSPERREGSNEASKPHTHL